MLGISTSYFASLGFSIYESVERAVELGFSHVELGANHDWEKDIWGVLAKIKKDFKDTSFSLHGYFPPVIKCPYMFNLAEGLTGKNVKVIDGFFRAGQILEVEIIGFHPGINNCFIYEGELRSFSGFKKFKDAGKIERGAAKENVYKAFEFLVKKGKNWGIKVAIENIYLADEMGNDLSLTLSGIVDFKAILTNIPGLFFIYDYGHSFIDEKDADCFFSFGEKIIEMHLSDVKDGCDHRAFGGGEIDLGGLLGKIKRLSKQPLLILEHSGEVTEKEILREKNIIDKVFGGV